MSTEPTLPIPEAVSKPTDSLMDRLQGAYLETVQSGHSADQLPDRLARKLLEYLRGGCLDLSHRQASLLSKLPDVTREALEPSLARTRADLVREWNSVDWTDEEQIADLLDRLPIVAAHAGERMIAGRTVGRTSQDLALESFIVQELFETAVWATKARATIARLRARAGIDFPQIAPAVFAAGRLVANDEERQSHQKRRFGLFSRQEGAENLQEPQELYFDRKLRLPINLPKGIVTYLVRSGEEAHQSLNVVFSRYRALTEKMERVDIDNPRGFLVNALGVQPLEAAEIIVRSLANAHAEVQVAREDSLRERGVKILPIPDGTASVGGGSNKPLSRLLAASNQMPQALRRLGAILYYEQGHHTLVEEQWKQLEQRFKMDLEKNPDFKIDVVKNVKGAVTARAMALQDLAVTGTYSLGKILSIIHHGVESPVGAAGAEEKRYLTNVSFYAARRYSASFASEFDPVILRMRGEGGYQEMRAYEVQTLMEEFERQMRRSALGDPSLHDSDLSDFCRDQFKEAVDIGRITRDEARHLFRGNASSSVERMITRVRALQEVTILSAYLAVEGEIPEEIIENFDDLPHSRRLDELMSPDSDILIAVSRSRQSYFELLRTTGSRLRIYRGQAKAKGADVRKISQNPGFQGDPGVVRKEQAERPERVIPKDPFRTRFDAPENKPFRQG